jgi:hypothetical protein
VEVLMAKQATEVRRKLVGFDMETWHALNLLSRETMKTFQELADEAFRDLLHKYGRPTDLKAALRENTWSARLPVRRLTESRGVSMLPPAGTPRVACSKPQRGSTPTATAVAGLNVLVPR